MKIIKDSVFSACIISIAAISLSACAGKVKLQPGFKDGSIQTVAVLPVEYNNGVQREKVDAIRKAVETELTNREFVVLADRLVRENCSAPNCPERKLLTEKYLVDAFVTVDVRSVSRNNFLAGYYNAITGKLLLSDGNNAVLAEVEETESERGGLVFNSGQVIQGLISQIENTEENSFNRLSAKFAETLVAKLPLPKTIEKNSDAVAVSVNSVKLKKVEPLLYETCAEATPNSLVTFVVNRARSNLREISPGKYCGTFYLDSALLASPLRVEARSPFGTTVRKDVDTGVSVSQCDLEGRIFQEVARGKRKIVLACAEPSTQTASCDPLSATCPDYKFLIFKGPSALGPYQKVAEVKSGEWTDRSSNADEKAYYQVIAVSPIGSWSLPRKPKLQTDNKS